MKKLKTTLFTCITLSTLLLTAACSDESLINNINAPKLKEKLGEPLFNTITKTQEVQLETVSASQGVGYTYLGEGKKLSPQKMNELTKLLLDDSSYVFDKTKSCLFVPEVAFHLLGKDKVTVLFSPWCNQIKVVLPTKDIILDCDPVSEKIKLITKE